MLDKLQMMAIWGVLPILFIVSALLIPKTNTLLAVIWLLLVILSFINIFYQSWRLGKHASKDPVLKAKTDAYIDSSRMKSYLIQMGIISLVIIVFSILFYEKLNVYLRIFISFIIAFIIFYLFLKLKHVSTKNKKT